MATPFPGSSDRLLAAIVESSDDAIVAKDLTGTILSWNAAAERMFGFTAAEAIGCSIRMIIPDDRQAEEDEVLARVRAGVGVTHFETIRRRKDGALLDISLTVSPIRNAEGEVVGASKVARDITEARRLARQLDEASRLKDEFIATLSHELRTPLNAVSGYARMLRSDTLHGDRRDHALEVIERNAATLTRLVTDLLDMSRIISGKIRLNAEQCDLAEVASDAIESMRPAMEAKRLRLERIIDAHAGPVWGDPERLLQVFWNLLSNAVKFTPRDGRIQVRVGRIRSQVEFVVSDTGPGIAPEFLPHVFERFRQGDATTTREFGGLGVGLAIVRHFVELHGGTVQAQSGGRGKGATFRVLLPLMIVHDTPPHEDVPHEVDDVDAAASRPLAGVRVLAVDDDADSLTLVKDVLEISGAVVATAQSAAEALIVIPQHRPDVLVVDLGMPGMDGHEFIRRLRNSDLEFRNVPAAALTAFARSEDRTRSLRSGFQLHLSKPIEPSELVAAILSLAQSARTSTNG